MILATVALDEYRRKQPGKAAQLNREVRQRSERLAKIPAELAELAKNRSDANQHKFQLLDREQSDLKRQISRGERNIRSALTEWITTHVNRKSGAGGRTITSKWVSRHLKDIATHGSADPDLPGQITNLMVIPSEKGRMKRRGNIRYKDPLTGEIHLQDFQTGEVRAIDPRTGDLRAARQIDLESQSVEVTWEYTKARTGEVCVGNGTLMNPDKPVRLTYKDARTGESRQIAARTVRSAVGRAFLREAGIDFTGPELL
jgi:hypothetical protein